MSISAVNILLTILILFLVPYLAGNGVSELLKLEKTNAGLYLYGWIGIWSMCQLITVPLVLMKLSFMFVVWLLTVWVVGLCVYGIYKNRIFFIRFHLENNKEKLALVVLLLAVLLLFVLNLCTQHSDWDDSRFVVNAVDIVRTNKMFLTDPSTGNAITYWGGDMSKDIAAPWAVFIAWCSKMTGVYPTAMAHTFLPVALLLAAICVWWLLSGSFFKEDFLHRCVFVILLILLNVYGCFSVYTEETFLLTRLWQGKAVIAGVGIPAAFWISFRIYDEDKRRGNYFLLLFLNMAMCLMSSMGVIIGTLFLGCMGLVYGILKKKWKITLSFWLMCIPNVIYYAVYYAVKSGFFHV